VVNYFAFVAGEVRQLLAELGYKSLDELIGRADLLQPRTGVELHKTKSMDLDFLTHLPDTRTKRDWLSHEKVHGNGPMLDDDLLSEESLGQAIKTQVRHTTHRQRQTRSGAVDADWSWCVVCHRAARV
jgi:glutamate synthase (ferredoxin)